MRYRIRIAPCEHDTQKCCAACLEQLKEDMKEDMTVVYWAAYADVLWSTAPVLTVH